MVLPSTHDSPLKNSIIPSSQLAVRTTSLLVHSVALPVISNVGAILSMNVTSTSLVVTLPASSVTLK